MVVEKLNEVNITGTPEVGQTIIAEIESDKDITYVWFCKKLSTTSIKQHSVENKYTIELDDFGGQIWAMAYDSSEPSNYVKTQLIEVIQPSTQFLSSIIPMSDDDYNEQIPGMGRVFNRHGESPYGITGEAGVATTNPEERAVPNNFGEIVELSIGYATSEVVPVDITTDPVTNAGFDENFQIIRIPTGQISFMPLYYGSIQIETYVPEDNESNNRYDVTHDGRFEIGQTIKARMIRIPDLQNLEYEWFSGLTVLRPWSSDNTFSIPIEHLNNLISVRVRRPLMPNDVIDSAPVGPISEIRARQRLDGNNYHFEPIDSADRLLRALDWINNNRLEGASYMLPISGSFDLQRADGINVVNTAINTSNHINITLRSNSNTAIFDIRLTGNGSIFTVSGNGQFIFENINLLGHDNNTQRLIVVGNGTCIMNPGAGIFGNDMGGVLVDSASGHFIMNGGRIMSNRTNAGGAAIHMIANGHITINNGEISRNSTGGAGSGGFIALNSGRVDIFGGLFTDNFSRSFGVLIDNFGSSGDINIHGGVFVFNSSQDPNLRLFFTPSRVRISNIVLRNNGPQRLGAGITNNFVRVGTFLEDGTFNQNTGAANSILRPTIDQDELPDGIHIDTGRINIPIIGGGAIVGNLNAVQQVANNAAAAAANAQARADAAHALATTANNTANAALTAANNAASAANTAQNRADDAWALANGRATVTSVTAAQTTANNAQTTANNAATQAALNALASRVAALENAG